MSTESIHGNLSLADISAFAASIAPRESQLTCFSEPERTPLFAQPGEIWTTRPSSTLPPDEQTSHWVLILERTTVQGHVHYRCAPMLSDAVMALDTDALLPTQLLGFTPAFAMGHVVSTTAHHLDEFVTRLPETEAQQLIQFADWVDSAEGHCPEDVVTGIPALDALDSRLAFHRELVAELNHIQCDEDVPAIAANVIPVDFFSAWQEALAQKMASEGAPRFHQALEVESLGLIIDVDAVGKADLPVTLNVSDTTGHQSEALSGARVLGAQGEVLGEIKGHSLVIPGHLFKGQLVVELHGIHLNLRSFSE